MVGTRGRQRYDGIRCFFVLAAALVGGTSCGAREQPAPWRPPDVLLISLDTVRADHLSLYGYSRETTPRIDRFARESIVFERAYAPTPQTLSSHASLFTGLYPVAHGLVKRGTVLSLEIPTMAELLSAHGYRAAAFVNAYFLAPEFGFSRGFEHYDFSHDIDDVRDADATNAAILSWIDGIAADEPFFLFAHYFDPHSDWERLPYDASEPFSSRFVGDAPDSFRAGNGTVWASRYLGLLNRENLPLSSADLRHLSDLYDAGIAYTDDRVGALLDALDSRGRLDRTIIILTSDHGEEFRDHGRLLHTQNYEELMHVPLLVSFPEMRGHATASCRDRGGAVVRPGRADGLVQHVDLLPTLAECIGFTIPENVQGVSFLPALFGGATKRKAVYFDTVDDSQRGVLRDDGWKLIEWPRRGRRRLYHLGTDPREQDDRSGKDPELAAALAARIETHLADAGVDRVPVGQVAVPEDVHRALEALGYVREESSE